MNNYFIITNHGWIETNDKLMELMPFTIDEMIADHSLLNDPNEAVGYKVFSVDKNGKPYWEFGRFIESND